MKKFLQLACLTATCAVGGCGETNNGTSSGNDVGTQTGQNDHTHATGDSDHTHTADCSKSFAINDKTYGTQVQFSVEGNTRTITSNGLPNHNADFPNAGNPNKVSQQNYNYTLPTTPQKNSQPNYFSLPQPFGIMCNGVLADPLAAEFYQSGGQQDRNWQLAPKEGILGIDDSKGHVQPDGSFHYHVPPPFVSKSPTKPQLAGWAGDGFPIYGPIGYQDPNNPNSGLVELKSSYRLKQGTRPNGPGGNYDGTYMQDYEYVTGHGDVDECNGRKGVTPEFPKGTYYYVLTHEYPHIPICFYGNIAESFKKTGGPGTRRRRPTPLGGMPPL
ncbi:MAG: YHYH protein [Myxococcota bacterium]